MASVPNGVETLRKISIPWVGCTNVTDRRQTDGQRHIANTRRWSIFQFSLFFYLKHDYIKSEFADFSADTWMHIPALIKRSSTMYCLHTVTGTAVNIDNFLANVNSRSRSLYVVVRPSVSLSSVCNVRAPYSGDWNFRQYFYAIWYIGHLWPLYKNFTEIVPGKPLSQGS